MNKIKLYLLYWLLITACNATTQKVNKIENPNIDSLVVQREYSFFHDKLSIFSPVKPYEEDATNTVSKLALLAYTDIKKYSFMPLVKIGMVTLTVSELKDADSSFDAARHINEIIEISESNESISINYGNPRVVDNPSFSGYWATAKTTFEGKETSNMYLNVLTDKKLVIITIAVYEIESDLNIISKLVASIKKKK